MEDEKPSKERRFAVGFLTLANIRDIVVIVLLAVVSWKLFSSDFSVTIDKFGFSEFLSILLAFFAIALAIAFYFKAVDTSNRFYDNVYKFTKDTSEILGRIEAGFGEKLRHIDEGYTGLRDRFEQMPFDLNKAKADAERDKEEVEKKQAERLKILEDLAQRAKLAENEKKKLFKEIETRDEELIQQRRQLALLTHEIQEAEVAHGVPEALSGYVSSKLGALFKERHLRAPASIIRRRFQTLKNDLASGALTDMAEYGLLDEDKDLTSEGMRWLRSLIRSHHN